VRYSNKTLLGNWFEEKSAEDSIFAELRGKREQPGSARSHRAKLEKCKQRVPHSYSEDGKLRFGDSVLVHHQQTGGSLACDVFEPLAVGASECLVSVSHETRPTARNTFIIEPVTERCLKEPHEEPSEDGILRYGEPFYLRVNDSLLVDEKLDLVRPAMYLTSEAKSATRSSRVSNSQAVFVTRGRTAAAVWKCFKPAGDKRGGVLRFLSREEPVQANAEVVIVHRQTNVNLSSDAKVSDGTDFGTEWEACCYNATGIGKRECLGGEFNGYTTADTIALCELEQNKFVFVTAQSPEDAVEFRSLPPPLTPEGLVQRVLDVIKRRGSQSVRSLNRSFKIMSRGHSRMHREDLKDGLQRYDVHVSSEDFAILLNYFDADGDGTVSVSEFMLALRGEINERRLDLIHQAYGVLDKSGDGMVTAKDVEAAYDTSSHPKVMSGEWTHAECVKEFMKLWDTQEADGIITLSEWEEYYRDISAGIDNDDEFELLIRNAWHISGGKGAAENSANTRVLVVHSDGSQEVVEIKDDLGLDLQDFAMMKERLVRQGVADIADIKLSGEV